MRRVLIIAGLILALIGCSANSDKDAERFAGEINGQLIDRGVYTTSFLYNYKDFTDGVKNYQPTTREINQLEKKTWKDLTKSVVLNQYISKNKLEVTQEEVIDTLLNNPPEILTNSGYFNSKGSFDMTKYRNSILTNDPVNTDFIKSKYFQNITMQKVQQLLRKDADISRSDVEKYYQKNYSTTDIILLSMNLDTYNPIVTDREVEIKWESDKKEYFYEPSLSIKYIIQNLEPTKQEIEQTRTLIDSLYFVLSQGGNFDSAVREFSSNVNTYPQGKMPFLKIENVPEIIRDLVATAQNGQVISPVSKHNVWYIYKVLEKTKTMVKLQEIKHPVQISQKTILNRREEFMQIGDLIKQTSMENAGYEYGWEVLTAENLNREKVFINTLGDLSDLINDAYGKPDGYIYPPIYNKNDRFLVMVQIDQNRLNKKKELALIFDEIKSEILKTKRAKLVSAKLRSLADNYQDINQEELLDVTYTEIGNVAKDTKLTKDGKFAINQEILTLSSKGDCTKCFCDETTGYLAIMIQKNRADKEYYKNNYYIIQGEYRQDALTNYYSTWLDEEIENAKVKIWFNMKDIYKGKY